MITKTLPSLALRAFRNIATFSHQKIQPERFQIIKKHSLHTEYQDLHPSVTEHTLNQWQIINDHTHIKFVIETGGFPNCSDIGLLFGAGTQNEDQRSAGSLSALQTMVHIKPDFSDSIRNYEFLQKTGANINFNYDVEQTYLGCSFFPEDQELVLDLILDLALGPKQLFKGTFQTDGTRASMAEELRVAAFGKQGIGMPKNGFGEELSNDAFQDFQRRFFTPHSTIISLSNFEDPLAAIASIKGKIESRYPEFLKREKAVAPVSLYKGGMHKVESQDGFFEFGVAFPGCEFRSPQMELYNILRIMLGKASSFSSGGPGKGMHSRCTKNLLNSEACIESASYVLQHYHHYGLFGITTRGYPEDGPELVRVGLRELRRLAHKIPPVQLERAKNILLAGIYMNIEKQSDRLEELTRNVNSYGRIKLHEFEETVRKVTADDIAQEMARLFMRPPTMVIKSDKQTLQEWPISKMEKAFAGAK